MRLPDRTSSSKMMLPKERHRSLPVRWIGELTIVETRNNSELLSSTIDVHASCFGDCTSTFRLNIEWNRTRRDRFNQRRDWNKNEQRRINMPKNHDYLEHRQSSAMNDKIKQCAREQIRIVQGFYVLFRSLTLYLLMFITVYLMLSCPVHPSSLCAGGLSSLVHYVFATDYETSSRG